MSDPTASPATQSSQPAMVVDSDGKYVPMLPVAPRPYDLPPLPPNRYYEDSLSKEAGRNAPVFIERTDDFDLYTFAIQKIIYSGKSAFQDVMIADTFNFGRALFLDGSIQSSEDDESLYHEMLVQPAMLRHLNPRDVLIVGGGEGATLREVLVHRSVNSVTMVDIDREVVELCREHLIGWHRGDASKARQRPHGLWRRAEVRRGRRRPLRRGYRRRGGHAR